MVDFALTHNDRKTILNADMGLGKTLATIETIERFGASRTLVVCPPRVIRVWAYQSELWNLDPDLLPLDQSGTKARLKAFDPNFNGVVVTNYQGFWRAGLYEALRKWAPQVVVFDEVHRLKSPGSKQSNRAATLAKTADIRLGLTGSLITKGREDIYGQARAIDPTKFGTRYDNFVGRYFNVVQFPFPRIVSERDPEGFQAVLREFVGVWKGAGLVQLPPFIEAVWPVSLAAKTKKLYQTFKKDMIADLGDNELVAANILVRALRLRQLSSGIDPVQETIMDPAKVEAALDWVDSTPDTEPLVIWTVFKPEADAVSSALTAAGHTVSRAFGQHDELDDWLDARTRILVIGLSVGAEGLDFTRARYSLYMSPTTNAGDFIQSQARTRRPGADLNKLVSYTYLAARGTMDAKVYAALRKKMSIEQAVREALLQDDDTEL